MESTRDLPVLEPDLHVSLGHAELHREPFAQVVVGLGVDVEPMFEHFELFRGRASAMLDLQRGFVRWGSLYVCKREGIGQIEIVIET